VDDATDWTEPELDDFFVMGASNRELSHSERLLEAERRRARERGDRYRARLDDGLHATRRSGRRRFSSRAPRTRSSTSPTRKRQYIGLAIAVGVLGAYLYLEHPFYRGDGLTPTPVGQIVPCPASIYPEGAQYSFEDCAGGAPARWARCSTLRVSIDSTNAPVGYDADTYDALNQLSAATGLHYRLVTGAADVTISWSSALMSTGIEADKAGVTQVEFRSDSYQASLSHAQVQISSRLAQGTGRNGEVPVLLHELGHAVGLAHFGGPVIMNPVDQDYATYRRGDLAGLAALYQPAHC
jgi:hypothetical protein